ncbi:GTP-binding protein [Peptoniphilus catoniae]|uniref:GTP-binding protein n=1 Tax=Peptoniphilus catoniae TaxID=1660341 RepID=UPI0010FD3E41|nr:GTP-binding protein [Peptoniphilus catoniae]
MKVIVVSGFLGSGKTSFIQSFAKNLDDIAILENDYAGANVDEDLLRETGREILSLEEGCICCSKKGDFATSVLTVANTINPSYLIIEPTGLGFLSKIIENIKTIEYENIELLSPITIVDYYQIDDYLKNYREIFIDQIENSSYILLSKTENISEESINKAIEILKPYTGAKIYKKHYKDFSKDEYKELIDKYDYSKIDLSNFEHFHMESLCYENVSYKDFQQMGTIFNAICQVRFGKVLRAKGFVKVDDKTVKIDIVNSKFSLEKYSGEAGKNLIFIGENLDKRAFDIMFKNK